MSPATPADTIATRRMPFKSNLTSVAGTIGRPKVWQGLPVEVQQKYPRSPDLPPTAREGIDRADEGRSARPGDLGHLVRSC